MGFKRLFFDIETSYCEGWFWRASFKTSIGHHQILKQSKIICICWKWQGSKKVHYLKWDENQNDKAMCKAFKDVLLDADEVVGHNGDKFDLKWLRTRFLYHGVTSLPKIKSLDTLKFARSQFSFPSNRLDAIGEYLGVGRKIDTGGIELWHDIIQKKKASAMKKMVDYCKQDVVLLEKVFQKLEGYNTPKTNVAVFAGGDKADCKYCASDNTRIKDRRISAAGNVSVVMECNDCKKYYTISLKAYNDSRAIK